MSNARDRRGDERGPNQPPASRKGLIIHIINSLGYGGAEVLLCNTLPLLPQYRHVLVTLGPPHDQLGSLAPYLEAHYCLHIQRPLQWPRGIRALRKIIAAHPPAMVHAHSQVTGLLAKVACSRQLPLFYTLHNLYSLDAFAANRLALTAERLTASHYHHLIGVSACALADYQRYVSHSGTGDVVYNMAGTEFFNAPAPAPYQPGAPLRCVSVGNLRAQKNYSYTLDAFKLLRHLPVTLDIYGEGLDRAMMERRIREDDLQHVSLKGETAAIAALLPQYHLYIITSSFEGFGIALLEAMAAGLPAFVSDIPVFREVGAGAVHYLNLNKPESLSDSLIDVYNGKLAPFYLPQGRSQAQKIAHPDIYIHKLLSVYNKYT